VIDGGITLEELQLAARNHALPLEALRFDVTPIGLHYLLTHYDIPVADVASYCLRVGGRVRQELALTLDELRARPVVRLPVTMECAGNGRALLSPRPHSQPWVTEAVGTAVWGGTPLGSLLEEAGVEADAVDVVFTGLDRGVEKEIEQSYERSLPVGEARRGEVLLAWEMNGEPLPPQHGFPLRLVVPGWYGMTSVKWLERITLVAVPFAGYQQTDAYRFRADEEDEGEALAWIAPRSLMIPPGIPDFHTRRRFVESGPCRLEGRAWSGVAPIAAVEVSFDGGSEWEPAQLEAGPSRWAWSAWHATWEPEAPGEYVLSCRARDEAGNEQPLEPRWNVGGYANNAVQRVAITVR
jgi:sulfane dehydrogenase subunit SoxC